MSFFITAEGRVLSLGGSGYLHVPDDLWAGPRVGLIRLDGRVLYEDKNLRHQTC